MLLVLDRRWSSLDWWFREELVHEFYKNVFIDNGQLVVKVGINEKGD